MPAPVDPGDLRLEGSLDVAHVPTLYPLLLQRREPVRRVDLSAVSHADSAGVALVQVLRRRFRDAQGQWPEVVGASAEFLHLCQAHRVEINGQ